MNGVYLLVLDRGFVEVGTVEPHPELVYHWLLRGRTVRRWGTDNGLAQLVAGPRDNTVLDPICEQAIPWRAVLKMIRCEDQKWLSHLKTTEAAGSTGGKLAR